MQNSKQHNTLITDTIFEKKVLDLVEKMSGDRPEDLYAESYQALDEQSFTTGMDKIIDAYSGGSGTSDYTALTNKPKINNVELNGDKSLEDLGISKIWETGEGEHSAKLADTTSTALGDYSVAEGYYTHAKADASHTEGWNSIVVEGANAAHAEGENTTAGGEYSHTEGYETKTNNAAEHAEGQNNKSNTASDTWGNEGNTLSSIGIGLPGVVEDAKNAFEVMQNGDIYILGLGNYDGTNPQDSNTVQDIILNLKNELESTMAALRNKQDTLTAGTNITIENNVISASGGGTSEIANIEDIPMILGGYTETSEHGFTASEYYGLNNIHGINGGGSVNGSYIIKMPEDITSSCKIQTSDGKVFTIQYDGRNLAKKDELWVCHASGAIGITMLDSLLVGAIPE